jgi:hypothetical protein
LRLGSDRASQIGRAVQADKEYRGPMSESSVNLLQSDQIAVIVVVMRDCLLGQVLLSERDVQSCRSRAGRRPVQEELSCQPLDTNHVAVRDTREYLTLPNHWLGEHLFEYAGSNNIVTPLPALPTGADAPAAELEGR